MSGIRTRDHHYVSAFGRDPRSMTPCPFCHSRDLMVYAGRRSQVECMQCGAEGPHEKDPVVAIEKWNIR